MSIITVYAEWAGYLNGPPNMWNNPSERGHRYRLVFPLPHNMNQNDTVHILSPYDRNHLPGATGGAGGSAFRDIFWTP